MAVGIFSLRKYWRVPLTRGVRAALGLISTFLYILVDTESENSTLENKYCQENESPLGAHL